MNIQFRGPVTPDMNGQFGERARAIADGGALPIKKLSETSTIAEDRILSIFSGSASNITLREIAGIAIALGVSLDTLLG